MKPRLFIALFSAVFLAMLGASALAEATQLTGKSANSTQLKADEKRTKQLRHGYIKHDGNKVYYYW